MKTPASAHILISGSAGELDWIIPVAKKMHDKGKIINISFLKKSARVSFNLNKTLKEITYLNFNINEITILKKMRSPFITMYDAAYYQRNGNSDTNSETGFKCSIQYFWIVMEYCDFGSLKDFF